MAVLSAEGQQGLSTSAAQPRPASGGGEIDSAREESNRCVGGSVYGQDLAIATSEQHVTGPVGVSVILEVESEKVASKVTVAREHTAGVGEGGGGGDRRGLESGQIDDAEAFHGGLK